MRKLIIDSDNVFRPSVSDSINKEDFFYEQYKTACEILVYLLETYDNKQSNENSGNQANKVFDNEYKNNIIAFYGDRGFGKTSAMLTFAYSLYNQSVNSKKNIIDIDNVREKIKNNFFAKPIIIDPSLFDELHNILDILLAKLYNDFSDICDKGLEERDEKDNYYERQDLINSFEKVYRCVSLIADPAKVKEHEFDYDGNMGKLSKLGESTRIKEYYKELIDKYLRFIDKNGSRSRDNNRKLIIAIDDVDLCNENIYRLFEQIRKYLILPNVIIIMALKIEQLGLGVVEHNLLYFDKLSKYNLAYITNQSKYISLNGNKSSTKDDDKDDNIDILGKVQDMSEKYITKLIPHTSRIKITGLERNKEVSVKYIGKTSDISDNKCNGEIALVDDTLKKIIDKTEMIFVKDSFDNSYLISNNMREFVDFYTMIMEVLQTVESKNRYSIIISNIRKFYEYCEAVFIDSVQPSIKRGLDFVTENDNNIHFKSIYFLLNQQYDEIDSKCKEDIRKIFDKGLNNEKKNSFSDVLKVLSIIDDRVNTEDVKKCANMIKVIYTAYLTAYRAGIENNEKKQYLHTLDEINYRKFIGDSIWGGMFDNVLPKTRNGKLQSRFKIGIDDLNDVLIEALGINDERVCAKRIVKYIENPNKDNDFAVANLLDNEFIENDDEDDELDVYILYWILLGLFVDNIGNGTVIDDNGSIGEVQYVSFENYIYGLSDLNGLYYKLNLERIGIEYDEYKDVVKKLQSEESNKNNIKSSQEIASSVDIMLSLPKYCNTIRISREEMGNNIKPDCMSVEKLFRKIEHYLRDTSNVKFNKSDEFEFSLLHFYGNHIILNEGFDISYMYSEMINKMKVD